MNRSCSPDRAGVQNDVGQACGRRPACQSRQEMDPSKEDIDTTNKITQALKYVSVRVLDHIIVDRAHQDYFSFARAGMV